MPNDSRIDGNRNLDLLYTLFAAAGAGCRLISDGMNSITLENDNDQGGREDRSDTTHGVVGELQTASPKLAQPPRYKVILLNDDYTPMGFVVEVLCNFFNLDVEKATRIMLKVHTEGKGVCGVYSKDVAESKATQVNKHARECEHPLLCSVEADD